jgi:hypothetical protein
MTDFGSRKFIKKSFQNKKAQIMGVPFQMIFTLILIAIFAVVGIVAIKYVISWQGQAQVSLFVNDFRAKVNDFRSVDNADYRFNSSLPTKIEYVCFGNTSMQSTTNQHPEIWDDMLLHSEKNMFLWPIKDSNYALKIDNLNLNDIPRPYCINNTNGKISIHLKKESNEPIARIVA